MVKVATEECQRVRCLGTPTVADLTALVTLCTPAFSSPQVAKAFCERVGKLCHPAYCYTTDEVATALANKVTCGAAGVIPAILTVIALYGTVSPGVANMGILALSWIASKNALNSDAIVLSAGGLDAILSVMSTHAVYDQLQSSVCLLLGSITSVCSPAAKRVLCASSAMEIVLVALRNHSHDYSLLDSAGLLLRNLAPESDANPAVLERHQRLLAAYEAVLEDFGVGGDEEDPLEGSDSEDEAAGDTA